MKITNKMNLPDAVVASMRNSTRPPNPESYSVTELLNSAKAITLIRRHWNDLEQDASDMVAALFGTAVHKVLETCSDPQDSEISLSTAYCGCRLSGRLDAYDFTNNVIIDYKTCTCSKILKEDFDDWKMQGLMYAWLMFREKDIKTKKLRFIALLKDWSKMKNLTVPPICEWWYDVNDSDYDWIESFIKNKLTLLKQCETLSDDELPECTNEERWNDGDRYAVYKDANSKRAIRLCDTLEEATKLYPDATIIKRSGLDIKCNNYCVCSKCCKRKEKE